MGATYIRQATREDSAGVSELLAALGYPRSEAFAEHKLTVLSDSPADLVAVADVEGTIVGVAHVHAAELFHEPGRYARVTALVVAGPHRRHGVGRALLDHVEAVARRMGCSRVEVTSAPRRRGAHAFYERLGYVEAPRRFVKRLQ